MRSLNRMVTMIAAVLCRHRIMIRQLNTCNRSTTARVQGWDWWFLVHRAAEGRSAAGCGGLFKHPSCCTLQKAIWTSAHLVPQWVQRKTSTGSRKITKKCLENKTSFQLVQFFKDKKSVLCVNVRGIHTGWKHRPKNLLFREMVSPVSFSEALPKLS